MPLPARAPLLGREDFVASALCAAELNEPFDLVHAPSVAFAELFISVHRLRDLVPYATLSLLGRLSNDERDDLRVGVARALAHFVDVYPRRVEELLLPLACDHARRVRAAASETLALLLRSLPDAGDLVERWRWHPDRAIEVLDRARRNNKKL